MCEAPTVLLALALGMAAVQAVYSACMVMGLQRHCVSAAGFTSPPCMRPPPEPDSSTFNTWLHRMFPSRINMHSNNKYYPDGSFKSTSSRYCILQHPVVSLFHQFPHHISRTTLSLSNLLVKPSIRLVRGFVQQVPRPLLQLGVLLHCTSFSSACTLDFAPTIIPSVSSFVEQVASAHDWWVVWSAMWAFCGLLATMISIQ